ncbi:hypothetical protein [Paenibacillus sp. FSL L8-0638]|uniref:hypothetical protein n=1 Tax=Paenibacillus TaxID=44249 RepID=UPI003158CA31
MNKNIENATEHHETSNQPYELLRVDYAIPSVEEYRALRKEAGLSQITEEAAAKGLPNRKGCTGDSREDCKLKSCTSLS